MRITIDLVQSPAALLTELTSAVRFALGNHFYIEEGEAGANFTTAELADPQTNIATLPPVASAPQGVNAGAAPAGVETDSAGHPYDVRIHSAGKSKIANGTWKLKKGVDKALVDQINAQNKQLIGATLPAGAPAAGALPALPTLPAVNPPAALPTLPPVAPVALPDVEIVVTDYATLAQYVAQQLVKAPEKTKAQVDHGLSHYGLLDATGAPDLTAMQHRPDVVMPFYQWLSAVLNLTK